MTADQAAERLGLPERGIELLERANEEENIFKALQAVQTGFNPRDVCKLYELEWSEPEEQPDDEVDGAIQVWECKTPRCRNKNRIATATNPPDCPLCHQAMTFVTSVDEADEVAHMRRIYLRDPGIGDPLSRTDKTKAPDFAMGGDED